MYSLITLYCLVSMNEFKAQIILKTENAVRTEQNFALKQCQLNLVSTTTYLANEFLTTYFKFRGQLYALTLLKFWSSSHLATKVHYGTITLLEPVLAFVLQTQAAPGTAQLTESDMIPLHPPRCSWKIKEEPNPIPFKRRPVLCDAGSSPAAGSVPVVPGGSA